MESVIGNASVLTGKCHTSTLCNSGLTVKLLVSVIVSEGRLDRSGKGRETGVVRGRGNVRGRLLRPPPLAAVLKVRLNDPYRRNDVFINVRFSRRFSSGTEATVIGNNRMAIVAGTPSLEPELANGYNSGDEYTGRTGNNLTVAEWQEVRIYTSMTLKLF